jgi:hypothetical protein
MSRTPVGREEVYQVLLSVCLCGVGCRCRVVAGYCVVL